ncbi:MAG: class I SAM-dependent methyltransferase [Nocardioidaceae bacterium]
MSVSPTPRGLLFGTSAESYERFRLGYPDEVVDRTLSYAGKPVRDALEVGAGTGKATRAFVTRGVRVVALEPDPEMRTVLDRETAGMAVRTVLSTFEAYDGPPTPLLYAAAAWHWTAPETRWSHAAGLLEEGGVLAVFGGPMRLADPVLHDAVVAVCPALDDASFQPHDDAAASGRRWPTREMEDSGLFTDVEEHHLPREVVVPKREYIGYLSTLSAYLQLEPVERVDVLRRIEEVAPSQVGLDLSIGMHLGRRR